MNSQNQNSAATRWHKLLELPEAEARRQAASWDWFALLRLIQCACPDKPRIGYSLFLSEDPVRLGQPTFFHHPSMTVADFARRGPQEPNQGNGAAVSSSNGSNGAPWIYSYHLGMFGPFGPLPLHLTEFASRRTRSQDPALFAFCNVLVHRFQSFFFRAWAEGRKEITLDRPQALAPSRRQF